MPRPAAALAHRLRPALAVAVAGCLGALATPALGQYQQRESAELEGAFENEIIERARDGASIDEKLGEQLPLDATFTNSDGREVTLGSVFAEGKPVVVQMAYYRCPSLCGEVMNGMVRSMRDLAGELAIGEDFEVLTISFDSRESAELAADNKTATVEAMGRSFDEEQVRDGWGFWVGNDLSIEKLTEAMGFNFIWVPEAQVYSHTGTIAIVTPEGKVSRYLQGPSFDAQALRLSVIGASEGKLQPSLKDAFVYYCFSFDPHTGKYTATARTVMMIGGGVTILTLGCVIGFLVVAERNGRLRRHPMAGTPEGEAAHAFDRND